MKKTFTKTVFRAVTHNIGRFIAIIAIVALGVGFLTGLLATTPDMKRSADSYYDTFNAADINVKSTTGFTADDVAAAMALKGVSGVSGAAVLDVPINYSDGSIVARAHYMDMSEPENQNNINRLELLSGSFPKGENECVVERSGTYLKSIKSGEKLTVNGKELTVTGVVGNTWYFSNEREITGVGNGRLGTIVYINSEPQFFTDLFVTVTEAKHLSAFSDHYTDVVKVVSEKIETQFSDKQLYLLDRSLNVGFVTFGMDADKIAAVSVVFPAFFFLVAALVALTTMTRMVEEERLQIGTLRSQGYSKSAIMSKYIIYSMLAAVIGCVIGVVVGFQILPALIWNAFKFTFHLPPLTVHFNITFAAITSAAALVSILAATIFACINTLKERPAQLLLPKAPKPGKRILLERIPFVWNHLKFKHKSALRNIFRYKKHFLMTVIGIAGCTALMLTGFGLRDSVNYLSKTQYDKIINYDLTVNLSEEIGSELNAILLDKTKVSDYMLSYTENGYIVKEGRREHVVLMATDGDEEIQNYIKLKPRKSKTDIVFNASSAVLTESVAKEFNLKVGDTIKYESVDGYAVECVLTAITENYVGNTLYLGSDHYSATYNTITANSPIAADGYDAALSALLSCPGVKGAEFSGQTRTTYDSLIGNISFVVIVLIVAAGGLAVIVLYNLINININERTKELATLKVLGYRGLEVAGYVFREIMILTVVGVLVGFGLGALLHVFVINQAETVEMMFGRAISPLSFLYSALLTIGFSLLVDFIMYFKLRKINMIESMKAPE